MSQSMLRLSLFGAVEVRGQNGSAPEPLVLQPKRLALLAYLATNPRRAHRRDTLLGLFWPELDSRHARGALSKALHYLRHALGDGVLRTLGEEELQVDDTRLWCDVAAFERAIDEGRHAEALELYRGDLLIGFYLPDAPEFERWVEEERDRLRRAASTAGWALADASASNRDLTVAIEWARRAQALYPEDETGLRRLITLFDRAGNRAGAIRTYEEFVGRLAREYDLAPGAETQELVARLRDGSTPSNGDQRTRAEVPSASSVPRVSDDRVQVVKRGIGVRLSLAGAAVLMAGFGLSSLLAPMPSAPVLDPQRVVVAPFENRTGQASLSAVGSMAADWVIQGLSQTGLVQVVPFAATLSSARFVAGLGDETDTAERIQALAVETGAGIVVSGAYYLQGDSLFLHSRITDAKRAGVLVALEPVSAFRERPLDAVMELRQRVMAGLAPHLNPRMSQHAGLMSRTPSYDAYREYAEGMELWLNDTDRGDWRAALERFARAASYDSGYTLPLVRSATIHVQISNFAAVDSIARLIAPHLDRLPEYDRLVMASATAWARGDYATSYQAVKRLAQLAPNTFPHWQVGRELLLLHRPREALRVFAQLDPQRGELRGWMMYWIKMTEAHHLLGEYDKELQVARRARELFPEHSNALRLELRALIALGRLPEVQAALGEYLASPGDGPLWGGILMQDTGLELRAHGHLDAARELFDRSLEWFLALPAAEQARRRRQIIEAYHLAGRCAEAEQELLTATALFPNSPLLPAGLGILAARRGDRAEAERIDAQLAAMDRPYLLGENTWWRARIAALLGEPDRAVALLRAAYAEGKKWWLPLHSEPDFESLRDYPPFRELMRPKG